MTRRFILTGAPGAGKTAVAEHLCALGHDIVEEAATSVIARAQASGIDAPWEGDDFIGAVASLQREREAASSDAALRFSDRSLFCTLALAEFLERTIPTEMQREAEARALSGWFDRRVFILEQLDFIESTAARRISLSDARWFGCIHADVYRRFGFELVSVPPATIADRAALILSEAARTG